jgi:hypothetical protein
VREGDWKLILDNQRGTVELFDLGRDPEERLDRMAEEAEVGGRLLEDLHAFMERAGKEAMGKATGEIDSDLKERLEALGYVN